MYEFGPYFPYMWLLRINQSTFCLIYVPRQYFYIKLGLTLKLIKKTAFSSYISIYLNIKDHIAYKYAYILYLHVWIRSIFPLYLNVKDETVYIMYDICSTTMLLHVCNYYYHWNLPTSCIQFTCLPIFEYSESSNVN
jgi:hypothetical protein